MGESVERGVRAVRVGGEGNGEREKREDHHDDFGKEGGDCQCSLAVQMLLLRSGRVECIAVASIMYIHVCMG